MGKESRGAMPKVFVHGNPENSIRRGQTLSSGVRPLFPGMNDKHGA
jgi:hypothetical protein